MTTPSNFEDIKIYMSKRGYDINKLSTDRLVEYFKFEVNKYLRPENKNDGEYDDR
jgi:hypothetical protein